MDRTGFVTQICEYLDFGFIVKKIFMPKSITSGKTHLGNVGFYCGVMKIEIVEVFMSKNILMLEEVKKSMEQFTICPKDKLLSDNKTIYQASGIQ